MRSDYQVAIIGGGASGLLCAVELLRGKNSFNGKDVVVFDGKDRVGQKLLATGNGQCNLSNKNLSEKFYHGDKNFISKICKTQEFKAVTDYLNEIGIPTTATKDGRVYPLSKQANSVLDTLREFLEYRELTVKTSERVKSISKYTNRYKITTSNGEYVVDKVVIAVGGASGKQFGTDGSSYALAESFGHKITQIQPSLVQIKTDLKNIKGLKGLKENACVSAFDGKNFLVKSTGDILFTDYGISGNAVFSISGYLVQAKNPKVIVEFLPDLTFEETENLISARKKLPYVKEQNLLNGLVNKKIGQAILKTVKNFSATTITNALKNFQLDVTGNLGFNYSQVTKGGIKTDDVTEFFESKLSKGVYLIGEVLNVDGDCGGYNLNFAFASGIICAKNIKNDR